VILVPVSGVSVSSRAVMRSVVRDTSNVMMSGELGEGGTILNLVLAVNGMDDPACVVIDVMALGTIDIFSGCTITFNGNVNLQTCKPVIVLVGCTYFQALLNIQPTLFNSISTFQSIALIDDPPKPPDLSSGQSQLLSVGTVTSKLYVEIPPFRLLSTFSSFRGVNVTVVRCLTNM
jgi:hypothetical protein